MAKTTTKTSTKTSTPQASQPADPDWAKNVPDQVQIYLPSSHPTETYNRGGLKFRRGDMVTIAKAKLLEPVSGDRSHRGATILEHILTDRVLVTPGVDKLPMRKAKEKQKAVLPVQDVRDIATSVTGGDPADLGTASSTGSRTPQGVDEKVTLSGI